LSDTFPIQNGQTRRFITTASEYTMRKVEECQDELLYNRTLHLLVCIDNSIVLGGNINNINKNTESILNTNN